MRTVQSPGVELRFADDDRVPDREYLDEVLVDKPEHVHAEVMSGSHIWIGIRLADGRMMHLNIYSVSGRAAIAYRAEVE